ncbi:hypothetical protein FRB93_008741 [Tulasnella sp. JGI-2019a]|nr:hypothetical protein FRB93_008741 [Tulasnella sp. JGI-2019a]
MSTRDRNFELLVRQQPKQARMCGVGGKADRRPIDPPPIVQLKVTSSNDPNGGLPPLASTSDKETSAFLQNPYYFMFASLAAPDSDEELHLLKDGKTRYTTGSVVSSLYHLKDHENGGKDAGFFVFPDLSVRTEGSYRLKLSLFEVVGANVYHCKSIFSRPFYVFTAKKFPGMEESTSLSCSLAEQGIKIRIRKDIRVRKRPVHQEIVPILEEDQDSADTSPMPLAEQTPAPATRAEQHQGGHKRNRDSVSGTEHSLDNDQAGPASSSSHIAGNSNGRDSKRLRVGDATNAPASIASEPPSVGEHTPAPGGPSANDPASHAPSPYSHPPQLAQQQPTASHHPSESSGPNSAPYAQQHANNTQQQHTQPYQPPPTSQNGSYANYAEYRPPAHQTLSYAHPHHQPSPYASPGQYDPQSQQPQPQQQPTQPPPPPPGSHGAYPQPPPTHVPQQSPSGASGPVSASPAQGYPASYPPPQSAQSHWQQPPPPQGPPQQQQQQGYARQAYASQPSRQQYEYDQQQQHQQQQQQAVAQSYAHPPPPTAPGGYPAAPPTYPPSATNTVTPPPPPPASRRGVPERTYDSAVGIGGDRSGAHDARAPPPPSQASAYPNAWQQPPPPSLQHAPTAISHPSYTQTPEPYVPRRDSASQPPPHGPVPSLQQAAGPPPPPQYAQSQPTYAPQPQQQPGGYGQAPPTQYSYPVNVQQYPPPHPHAHQSHGPPPPPPSHYAAQYQPPSSSDPYHPPPHAQNGYSAPHHPQQRTATGGWQQQAPPPPAVAVEAAPYPTASQPPPLEDRRGSVVPAPQSASGRIQLPPLRADAQGAYYAPPPVESTYGGHQIPPGSGYSPSRSTQQQYYGREAYHPQDREHRRSRTTPSPRT